MDNRSELARARFFDKTVHIPAIKNCISGDNENRVLMVLKTIGYTQNVDFVRQHPIGLRYVLDFAFIPEQVAVEIDGKHHRTKKQRKLDDIRDRFLHSNNWVTVRIQDGDFHGYKASFYKNLIKEIVEDRRGQFNRGTLFPLDFPRFVQSDYE